MIFRTYSECISGHFSLVIEQVRSNRNLQSGFPERSHKLSSQSYFHRWCCSIFFRSPFSATETGKPFSRFARTIEQQESFPLWVYPRLVLNQTTFSRAVFESFYESHTIARVPYYCPCSAYYCPCSIGISVFAGMSSILTLWHATNADAAESILRENRFRAGSDGYGGGGIYFASSQRIAEERSRNGNVVLFEVEVPENKCEKLSKGNYVVRNRYASCVFSETHPIFTQHIFDTFSTYLLFLSTVWEMSYMREKMRRDV